MYTGANMQQWVMAKVQTLTSIRSSGVICPSEHCPGLCQTQAVSILLPTPPPNPLNRGSQPGVHL